jgi:hypothetical protein
MDLVMLGIDLAKNVFALHGANELGRVETKRLNGSILNAHATAS